ncbi:MAG TPA: aminodeoxychorismate synthase component I, partial [Bacillota bacterium]|nr:aminodeoxychorismate synthase component I [Bacillota bacterium]
PSMAVDDLAVPDCIQGFYDLILAYDHQEENWLVCSSGFPLLDAEARAARAARRLAQGVSLLEGEAVNRGLELSLPAVMGDMAEPENLHTHFTRKEYCAAVQKAKDYIAAGDIFQMNMTQRFDAPLPCPPFELYKVLRTINPAPFASYFNYRDLIIASASPERFLLVSGNRVETRPIKGTRPRGASPDEDLANREELLASAKDRAELVMIIDLERNDLGRVCETGSVRVPDLIRLEEYPTVFHLVSTVEGLIPQGKDTLDILSASFPGGSITGAPKIRAMEIIEELEPVKRGIYTGSLGYISFNGSSDLNILIRTFVIRNNQVHFQVGGGIVADSDPEMEYEETLHKGRALRAALTICSNRRLSL